VAAKTHSWDESSVEEEGNVSGEDLGRPKLEVGTVDMVKVPHEIEGIAASLHPGVAPGH
jgi:hypothetical protein